MIRKLLLIKFPQTNYFTYFNSSNEIVELTDTVY